MKENEPIEQPDVVEKKDTPKPKPSDFGYKKFEPKEHREALLKAKTGQDKESEEETKKLEAELAGMDDGKGKKTLKPQELKGLDDSIKLKEEDRKAPRKTIESLERKAFVKTLKTLTETNKLPIRTEDKTHIFEFKGLTKDGHDVEPQEVQKLLEHVDRGGDIPPNIEFHFHTSFQKDRPETEVIDIDYRTNIHQIMRNGLETTLGSLLSLSYAAASHYDARRVKTNTEALAGKIETTKPQKENIGQTLDGLKKQLLDKNIQASTIHTAQWQALEVNIPEKQKQFSIVHDGTIFQLTEKHLDKAVEIPIQTPSEIIQYIEKESK